MSRQPFTQVVRPSTRTGCTRLSRSASSGPHLPGATHPQHPQRRPLGLFLPSGKARSRRPHKAYSTRQLRIALRRRPSPTTAESTTSTPSTSAKGCSSTRSVGFKIDQWVRRPETPPKAFLRAPPSPAPQVRYKSPPAPKLPVKQPPTAAAKGPVPPGTAFSAPQQEAGIIRLTLASSPTVRPRISLSNPVSHHQLLPGPGHPGKHPPTCHPVFRGVQQRH